MTVGALLRHDGERRGGLFVGDPVNAPSWHPIAATLRAYDKVGKTISLNPASRLGAASKKRHEPALQSAGNDVAVSQYRLNLQTRALSADERFQEFWPV